jgi:acetyl esterase/lipase
VITFWSNYAPRAGNSFRIKLAGPVRYIFSEPAITSYLIKSISLGPGKGLGPDNSILSEEVRALEAALNQAGVPHEITVYEDQPHAFVTDMESIRAGGPQGEAWAQMLGFLEQHLKQGGRSQSPTQPTAYRAPFAWRYYFRLAYEHAFGTASHRGDS